MTVARGASRRSVLLWALAIAAFLVTRLPFLEADVPSWGLTQYAPIDEFAYTIPAFNVVNEGAWALRAAPWAPIEGSPVNMLQNVVAAGTLALIGDSYWGLRASSVVLALVTFVALIAVVRHEVRAARKLGDVPGWLGTLLPLATAAFLLVDFSSLLSARIVEPTVSRLAITALIVLLVARGTFLGERRGLARTVGFGALVGGSVLFVYVYNAFVVPAALVAVAWWAYRSGGRAGLAQHVVAFAAGGLLSAVAYFGLILVLYQQSPIEWYRVWFSSFEASARAAGFSTDNLLSLRSANVFRLDPAFLGLAVASLGVSAWATVRRPTPLAILLGVGLAAFIVQAGFVADYPARKFVAILVFVIPIVAASALSLESFRAWVRERSWRVAIALAWLAVAIAIALLETRLRPLGGMIGLAIVAAAIVGSAAIVVLALVRRRWPVVAAATALGLAVLVPPAGADLRFVYLDPAFTYRDAQIEVAGVIDGTVTAGGLSFAMQLYNSSRPALHGYFFGITRAEYDQDVVRMFTEGTATSMFSYVDADLRGRWEALGFRVVEAYDITLPRGRVLGRYVYAGPPLAESVP